MNNLSEHVISVSNLGKCYKTFDSDRAKILSSLLPGKHGKATELWALRDINFQVQKGESLAIIGRNGGGKSTLLEILTGTLTPTTGEVSVHGRVCALLELGSGFNPEYSGRDNVLLNGLLLGLTKHQILTRFDEIEAFAEIGAAIDRPVKTYSSGMLVRLAFAVQVLADPNILIIDEALSVGDFFFQQKCMRYIRTLKEKGVTTLFVSHDMGSIRDLCDRAILLDKGRMTFSGETREAIKYYIQSENSATDGRPVVSTAAEISLPEDAAAEEIAPLWVSESKDPFHCGILAIWILDEHGIPRAEFTVGDTITFKVKYRPPMGVGLHITVELWNKYGQLLTSVGSSTLGIAAPRAEKTAECLIFCLSMQLDVELGNYSVGINAGELLAPNQGKNHDSSPKIGPISVRWDYERDQARFFGMVGLQSSGFFQTARER